VLELFSPSVGLVHLHPILAQEVERTNRQQTLPTTSPARTLRSHYNYF